MEDDVEIINNDDHKDAAALYFADRYTTHREERKNTQRRERENAHTECSVYTQAQPDHHIAKLQRTAADVPSLEKECPIPTCLCKTGKAEHSVSTCVVCANRDKAADRQVVFSNELGLAVESLPPGTTLEALWKVV